ncbi:MAG: hypothetical protein JF588_22925 [Caulobacterales bacterium]|nr:hypothetical protein [Caulobacterales bacterium]
MLAMIAAATALVSNAGALDASPSLQAHRLFGPAFATSAACKATGRYQTDWEPALLYRQSERMRARRLEDMPKPDYEKTVLRTVEGCSAPLVVGTSVGR